MATIRSQMVLNDGISGVLMKMNRALNTTLNAFEQVQRASGRAVDATQIQAARAALVQANNEVEQMAEGYRRAAEQEEVLNRGLRNGNSAAGGLLGKVKGIVATLAAGAGLKALTGLSDKLTSTTARLSFMVDDGGSVDALEQKIMASAQRSRSYYLDTASAIASMGSSIILQSLVREADPRTAPAQFRVKRGQRHIKGLRHVFDRFALLPKLLERLPGLERCESVARH